MGLYGEIYGGDSSGAVHLLIGADNYGALDIMAAALADPGSDFAQLSAELSSFLDNGGRWLYRSMSDLVWVGEEAPAP